MFLSCLNGNTASATDPGEMPYNVSSHLGIHSMKVFKILDPVYKVIYFILLSSEINA